MDSKELTWAGLIEASAKKLDLGAKFNAEVVYNAPAAAWLALVLRRMADRLDHENELRRMSVWGRFKFHFFCYSAGG